MNRFDEKVASIENKPLTGSSASVFQINIGLKCNIACLHCHVLSSPKRTEMMSDETLSAVSRAIDLTNPELVDITGGAPEMHPRFRDFVVAQRKQNRPVQVRTNLVIFFEEGYDDLPEFFAEHKIQLVASLPCYLEENVDSQRGPKVYQRSVKALQMLNNVGYGKQNDLPLHLVYNPGGPSLPPPQETLEQAYKKELKERFDIVFHQLYTITNMPIGRFKTDLQRDGKLKDYQTLLESKFNPSTLEGLMCRHQIEVGYDGTLYDCDFNLAMGLSTDHGAVSHINDLTEKYLPAYINRRVVTGPHCFGCTAGSGSSCGGSLVAE